MYCIGEPFVCRYACPCTWQLRTATTSSGSTLKLSNFDLLHSCVVQVMKLTSLDCYLLLWTLKIPISASHSSIQYIRSHGLLSHVFWEIDIKCPINFLIISISSQIDHIACTVQCWQTDSVYKTVVKNKSYLPLWLMSAGAALRCRPLATPSTFHKPC